MCFWLMFVMLIAVFRESNLLQGVGEERRKRNGGESRVASRTFTEPHGPIVDSPFPALRPREGLRVRAPPRPSWSGGYSAVENLGELSGRAPRLFLLVRHLPPPHPGDYVHASLGFMDVERGAKEGLGGTSGFSEGVRFSPARVSEL